MNAREFNEWARQMREQGVKGPLYAPDHDPQTCPECQRVAAMRAAAMGEKGAP